MSSTRHVFSGVDADLIDPPIDGLDESFDEIIRGIPQSLIGAPDDHTLPPQLSRDPMTPLQALRDRCGYVVRGDRGVFGGVALPDNFGTRWAMPHFVVLGVEELDQISMDRQHFRNGQAYGLLGDAQGMAYGERVGTIPTIEDDEGHDELRALYDTFLNAHTMATRSQRLIRPIGTWLIERVIARLQRGEPVCLCRDLALPLTYKAMSTMLGVPQHRLTEFVHLGDMLFSAAHYPEEAARGADQLYSFFLNQVQERKSEPKRDLVTYLLGARKDGERALTDEQIAITARFILPAGIDTTWRGLALVLMTLLAHEEQYREVCAAPQTLVRKAVEEGLRYAPSGFVAPRLAGDTRVVGGVEIPAGSHITLLQGVANRDPRRWDNPDRFDIHRKFKTHRTFNTGIHSCAGQHLARLEMVTCLELFAERLPNLRLTVPPEQIEVRGFQIRAPICIPVMVEK